MTGTVVIRAEGLGKCYELGRTLRKGRTLREALAEHAAAAVRGAGRVLGRGPAPRDAGEFWALRDVSFEIVRGEAVALIGGNGAGKSTLLKMLTRVTAPTTGRAEIRGRVGSLLEVGTGFHPDLSGRENVFLNGAILGMSRGEVTRKFDEIVAFAEVERFIDVPVKRYSSGMYLRLAFAVAAHLEPEILLVDEVLAVGDAAFQRKCLGKMEDVSAHGRTVVFVSHNMAAVQSLCHRALWLRDGRLVADGPAKRIVTQYLQAGQVDRVQQSWPDPATAPGNARVRLHRAAVRPRDPHGDSSADAITTRTSFRLEFEYWNLQPDARLNLSLHVYNEQGAIVFNAVPSPDSGWRGRPFPVGLFRDVCEVPGDLMNDGAYRVELLVVQDEANVIFKLDGVLTFQVLDDPEQRGAWFGRWVGAVRPRLPWSTQMVAAGPPDDTEAASVAAGVAHGADGVAAATAAHSLPPRR
jgi:lipopolysaccharide transport system ATP-binding protein